MDLRRKLDQLRDELVPFADPQERLSHIVDRARRAAHLPPDQRTDVNRVPGCVSVVWLAGEAGADGCAFRAHADSPVVHGLLALLCEFFSGASAAEVTACELDPLAELGISRGLSPTRINGLASARARIRAIARAAMETAC